MYSSPSSCQPLNGLDIALRCIDHVIRDMGFPGFETQMIVWLKDRLDAPRLQSALQRLGRRHPVVTSRLIDNHDGTQRPFWEFRSGASPALGIVELAASGDAAALDAASELFSTPRDPAHHDPIRFHLLRRPGAGDALVVQYNHTLMDNSGTGLVLRELDELARRADDPAHEHPRYEPPFLVSRYLRSVPRPVRLAATLAAARLQSQTLRGKAALLGPIEHDNPLMGRLRIAARTLEPELTRAIRARAIAVCGLPSLSMAILASTLRAVQHCGPQDRNLGRRYMAGIGLDLNLREKSGALFQNLLSLVAINARSDELADRDGLVRLLSEQMRDRLVQRHDIGVMRLAHTFQRRPRYVSWVMGHIMRYSCTVWYAYFGALDALGPRFCGCEIDRIHYVGPAWSPMGIGLVANQYAGRLHIQLTYESGRIAEPLATAYLDRLVADLREFAAGGGQ